MANSFDKLDRVPPVIPIIWQDWDSSMDILGMTPAEEGLFFRLIRKQWMLDELPADPWTLAGILRVRDYRTVKSWLEKYDHLLVKEQRHYSKCTVKSQQVSGESTVNLHQSYCKCPVTILNLKLKNLKNDVILKRSLGTTEPEPKPEPQPENLSLYKSLETSNGLCIHERLSEDKNTCLDCGYIRGSKQKGVGQ